MRIFCDLLLSDVLIEKKERIIDDILARKMAFNHYIIVLSKKEDEYLEIHHSSVLEKRTYQEEDWFVVGVSIGYFDAVDLIKQLTQKIYDQTKDANIKEYILCRQAQFEKEND